LSIALPLTRDSFRQFGWTENVAVEVTYDPVVVERNRWMWTPDGLTLINEASNDVISANPIRHEQSHSFTAFSRICTSISESQVKCDLAGADRRYVWSPSTGAVKVSLTPLNTASVFNKTA